MEPESHSSKARSFRTLQSVNSKTPLEIKSTSVNPIDWPALLSKESKNQSAFALGSILLDFPKRLFGMPLVSDPSIPSNQIHIVDHTGKRTVMTMDVEIPMKDASTVRPEIEEVITSNKRPDTTAERDAKPKEHELCWQNGNDGGLTYQFNQRVCFGEIKGNVTFDEIVHHGEIVPVSSVVYDVRTYDPFRSSVRGGLMATQRHKFGSMEDARIFVERHARKMLVNILLVLTGAD